MKKLNLRKDTLVEISTGELAEVAGAAQTIKDMCQSGVAPCYPTYGCFTHHSSLDCITDICSGRVCS